MPLSSGCSCRAGSWLAGWDGKDLPTPGCSPGACGWELTCAHCHLLRFCLLPKVLGEPEPHQSSPRLVYSESVFKVGLGHTKPARIHLKWNQLLSSVGREGKWTTFQGLCPVSLACDGVRHVMSNIAYSLLQSENHQIRESVRCLVLPFRVGALNLQHQSPESAFLGHRTSRAHGGGCSSWVGSAQSTWVLMGWGNLSKN